MTDETVLLELTRSEVTTLIGILQVEKGRFRSRGDDATADALGYLQDRIIAASDSWEGGQ